jgi:DNA-binding IclR family transcriptional regulator
MSPVHRSPGDAQVRIAFIYKSNLYQRSARHDLARLFSYLHLLFFTRKNAALTGPGLWGSIRAVQKKKRPAAPARGYSAPALEKGIEIVELLATVPGGLSISEIAGKLRRSMNEVFRIIVVMEAKGWLAKDPDTYHYSVTYHVLEMAMRATPAQSLSAAAAPIMEKLSIDTNQSCHLVVRAGGRGLIIQRQENASLQGGFALRPGASVDLTRSCSGHVLLAFMEANSQEAVLKQLPRPLGWPLAKLAKRLQEVRKRGYELQPSARTAGVTDVSYPIHAFDGRLVAALTVPYLTMIDDSASTTLDQTRQLLAAAARKLSAKLGAELGKSPGTTLAL